MTIYAWLDGGRLVQSDEQMGRESFCHGGARCHDLSIVEKENMILKAHLILGYE